MTKKSQFLLFLFLTSQLALCQNEKSIHGKITAKNSTTAGIRIINLANEKETVSDEKGEFEIDAKIDDLLVLSSMNMEPNRTTIEKENFETGSINIEMIPKITQLQEVKIYTYPEFDAVKMGILSKPAKKYTPAERRLKAAGDFKPIHLLGLLGGSLPIEPIINKVSGKTKWLKKELKLERKEFLLSDLSELYEKDYFVKELKIKPELVTGFQYYAVENSELASALRSTNRSKPTISFILTKLALNYNLLQGKEYQ